MTEATNHHTWKKCFCKTHLIHTPWLRANMAFTNTAKLCHLFLQAARKVKDPQKTLRYTVTYKSMPAIFIKKNLIQRQSFIRTYWTALQTLCIVVNVNQHILNYAGLHTRCILMITHLFNHDFWSMSLLARTKIRYQGYEFLMRYLIHSLTRET